MTNQDHVFNILDDVLLLLSGQGFPTPEKTYKLDGGWGLALSDLRRCFEKYRTRIAELEAERDAAQAGEARAVEALDVFARAYRVSMLPFAPGIDEADGAHHWMPHGWPSVADFKLANSVLSDSSALSWLAQQRAEAARIERQLQAMLMQHRHDIRDLGQLLQDERCKVATIEAAWYAARAEVERLREDAARNRWCEEMRADVGWSQVDERWVVNVGERRYSHPDRNAAIDAAMKGGK